jgi:membrane protein required for colicin V production
MNPFDWMLVAILAYSAIQAFLRGLLREVFSLAGLVAGIILAGWNYTRLSAILSAFISNAAIANIVAFLVIAFGVMLLAIVAGRIVHTVVHAAGLGLFNRLGGMLFGLVRGALACVAILMALSAFLPTLDWVKNSRLAPYFIQGVHAVSFVVPQDLEQLIQNGVLEIKHSTADWIKLHH